MTIKNTETIDAEFDRKRNIIYNRINTRDKKGFIIYAILIVIAITILIINSSVYIRLLNLLGGVTLVVTALATNIYINYKTKRDQQEFNRLWVETYIMDSIIGGEDEV